MIYYRLYFISTKGSFLAAEIIAAESDVQAIELADLHAGDHAMELWNLGRMVQAYPAVGALASI